MQLVLKFILGMVVLLLTAAGAAWLGWKFLKKSHDPGRLVFKWIITAGALIALIVTFPKLTLAAPLFAAFVGVWLGGYVYDTTGSYALIWYLSILLGLASAAIHLPIKELTAQSFRAPRPAAA